jgi:hypothetical protein
MSTSFVDTLTSSKSHDQIQTIPQQQQQQNVLPSLPQQPQHHYKIRLPSFKKLKNKLSMRKSISSASNLNDLSKLKITSSISTQIINPVNNNNNNPQLNGSLQNLTNYYHNSLINNDISVIHEDQIMDTTPTTTPSNTTTTTTSKNNIYINEPQINNNNNNVKLRVNNSSKKNSKLFNDNVQKRISLPANINYDIKHGGNNNNNHLTTSTISINPTSSIVNKGHLNHLSASISCIMKPLNRNSRRASMSELGYGKIESYKRLEKLGEVRKIGF